MLASNASRAPRDIMRPVPDLQSMHVDDYTDQLHRICGRFRVEAKPTQRAEIHGAVKRRTLSRFDVAMVTLDANRVVRDGAMIRKDPGEHLFLIYQAEGQSTILQNDRVCRLYRGDFFIADSSVPSEFIYEGRHSTQISLHLPRDEMVARIGKDCVGGTEIERGDTLSLAMGGVLDRMLETDAGSAALGEALINILSAYFHARARGNESVSARLYRRAVQQLEAQARDSSFGIDALATDCGVSRRTLQRVFAEHGDSFSTRLQAFRLELARARLMAGEENIASLAFDCGFNDLSNFYRLFRDRFGVSPGKVRAKPLVS
ncbi:helix-turn-helix domain-containing protein [Rhodobacteraceae bacterium HSP-20]|uniref:Helix-turn-helix domain-containing protein n=1 Tax=Paragemmobacter amnigenus TaxID=2852097 RepID=A0ABS6J1I0_9RHOB|nr:helix-turn-helix domain-containing protein [Rhodobacter amnigenus]MBU9697614.1 helix-turn-helix domain-containing protein [Rhodobacter amnigenus]MBV4388841.1 helix-turn-helix domain-containing protein [Rhodobacter amnigenus]